MSTIGINLFFPAATVAFLLHIRRKYKVDVYLAWSCVFLALALGVWLTASDVVYFYCGHLCGSGFESWGAPLAVLAIILVCVFALRRSWQRWVQGAIALVAFNFCLAVAGWVS